MTVFPRQVLLEEAKRAGVRPMEVTGPCRTADLVAVRRAIIRRLYFMGLSQQKIGIILGRDHSTVKHHLHAMGLRRKGKQ